MELKTDLQLSLFSEAYNYLLGKYGREDLLEKYANIYWHNAETQEDFIDRLSAKIEDLRRRNY